MLDNKIKVLFTHHKIDNNAKQPKRQGIVVASFKIYARSVVLTTAKSVKVFLAQLTSMHRIHKSLAQMASLEWEENAFRKMSEHLRRRLDTLQLED